MNQWFGGAVIIKRGSFAPVEIENGRYLKFMRKHWLTHICSVVVDISVFQIHDGLASSPVLHIRHSCGVSAQ